MRLLAVVGVLVGTLMASTGAQAVTYDFSGSAHPSGPFTLGCAAGGILNSGCSLTFNSAGIGVNGSPDTDPGNIDSFPYLSFETVLVSFLSPFMLQSFELGNFGRADDYEYSLNGGAFSSPSSTNPASVNTVVTSFAVRASSFRLADLIGPDSFTLKSFTGFAAVPLPAGLALLGTGLAALGLFSWKKKRSLAV